MLLAVRGLLVSSPTREPWKTSAVIFTLYKSINLVNFAEINIIKYVFSTLNCGKGLLVRLDSVFLCYHTESQVLVVAKLKVLYAAFCNNKLVAGVESESQTRQIPSQLKH